MIQQMPPRLLLFVEPFPVRSGVEDFRTPFEIFRDIASMLALQNIPTAIICNSIFAARSPRNVRTYTPASFGISEAMSFDWQDKWIKMLTGQDVGQWRAFYESTLNDFKPT